MTTIQYAARMPAVERRHAYQPRGTQLEAIRAGDSEVLYCGAAGTGKSRACLEKAHLMCLTYPGMRVLFVRKTQVSLVESGLVTFKRDVVRDMLDREVRWYGGSGSEPAAFRYSNGSVIIIGGMDKASKVLSTEYDLIYVQEATELEEDDWETLTTRLRNGRAPIQQIIADCNPQEPTPSATTPIPEIPLMSERRCRWNRLATLDLQNFTRNSVHSSHLRLIYRHPFQFVLWLKYWHTILHNLHRQRLTHRFMISTIRLFRIHGVFATQRAAIPIVRLVDITVERPVLGRWLNYGHFKFESAAQIQGLYRVSYVKDIDEVENILYTVIGGDLPLSKDELEGDGT